MGKIITEALPHDLPENWTDNQYVSPGGVEVGLTAQHGYNYLMKQVNASQRAIKELDDSMGIMYTSPLERSTPDTTGYDTLLAYISSVHNLGKRRIEATVSDFPDMPMMNWGFKLIATRSESNIWDVRLIKALASYEYVREMYANGTWVQNTWSRVAIIQEGTVSVEGNGYANAQVIEKDNIAFFRNFANDTFYTELELSLDGAVKCRYVHDGKVVYETLLSSTLAPASVE